MQNFNLLKIQTKLKQSKRKIYLFLISIVAAFSIVLFDSYLLPSSVLGEIKAPEELQQELVDLDQFSDMIASLEHKWEKGFENYFEHDFSNSSRSAKQISKKLSQVRDEIGVNPAVIWAVPKADFLHLFLITPEQQFVVKKIRGANRERLTKRIIEFEKGIADRQSLEYFPPSRLIYNWLFKPLDPYLEAEKIDTLLLCTGPNLRSLPFAALHDGEKFLVEKYNLARIPAFGLTDTSYQSENHDDKQVLAMGASEFTDLPSLPGVKIELDTIVSKPLWSGRKILNQDFTTTNLIAAQQTEKFDIVHIASHSEFSAGAPEFSYIQFSDRRLGLDQITDLTLDKPQVDLLVLSACKTALGDEEAEFGFAGLAIQAGVKSALASLWTINDAGTVVLMSEFYQELKSTAIKAKALREAQINMLTKKVFVEDSEVKGSGVTLTLPPEISDQQTDNFDHPFYWSGFTVIGNPW